MLAFNRKACRIGFYILIAAATYFAFTPFFVPTLDEDFGDKINHLLAFFMLFLSARQGFGRGTYFVSAWLAAYGLFIECVQYFLPDRYFSVADILADVLGILLGVVAYRLLRPILF